MSNRPRARQVGITIGTMPTGPLNAITDVAGVRVGHVTLIAGRGRLVPGVGPVRTGVTAIWPRSSDVFEEPVVGTVEILNGFGEVTNMAYVMELGRISGPILITGSLNVPSVYAAALEWSLEHYPRMGIDGWGAMPIVTECYDGWLNDMRGLHVKREHVFKALDDAQGGPVAEGAVGGGTGMVCFDFKGGIGTASRRLRDDEGGYTLGVLVASNFGWKEMLTIDGVPVGRELQALQTRRRPAGGSIIMVTATDAPLSYPQLRRVARRCGLGLARTGSVEGHTSGDFVIGFSTAPLNVSDAPTHTLTEVNEWTTMSTLFQAAVEATEEAVINSLFKAETMDGRDGNVVPALPVEDVVEIMKRYGRIQT